MTTDHGERELSVLDEATCLALLRTTPIGRLVFTEGALPAVQPAAFAFSGGEVCIPTYAGSKVAVASVGAVVAFEVDEVDAATRTGWNVTVIGPSRVVTDARDVARLDELGVRPWVGAGTRCYICVQVRLVQGRRVKRSAAAVDGISMRQPSGQHVDLPT
ncbi:pyridoxamine 5'-phosphate oxidase family protein [Modestobacter sp. VKM Ac-2979]|uniref:pyridoxamine 5'-phosphate oxidase family protein n=1 Tax=unclassified Modestobacter TaxID=2643866 RepID=UPI0022AB9175|nr:MULTISPECIES: pyridoxamine 5'-phosphate oxidase family protein [unclassified Modestobacter]MCZ2812079.1 pyridoxamine 5'-phosphate oxidase family protein [Modestobacter sp. VKM Ac-2979]MCZ2843803.1 pyridoxamine 5'-phosphate oxidase family protein [Modestobacter sp. VKM Ac-2980]